MKVKLVHWNNAMRCCVSFSHLHLAICWCYRNIIPVTNTKWNALVEINRTQNIYTQKMHLKSSGREIENGNTSKRIIRWMFTEPKVIFTLNEFQFFFSRWNFFQIIISLHFMLFVSEYLIYKRNVYNIFQLVACISHDISTWNLCFFVVDIFVLYVLQFTVAAQDLGASLFEVGGW